MPELVDYYTVLGVSSTASAAEIRKARQRLAMLYHPDRNKSPAANQMMALVNRAAEVLLDPGERSRYDAQLVRDEAASPSASDAGEPTSTAKPAAAERATRPTAFRRAVRGTCMALATAVAWAAGIALGVAGLILCSNADSLGRGIIPLVMLVGLGLLIPPLITAGMRRVLYGARQEPDADS